MAGAATAAASYIVYRSVTRKSKSNSTATDRKRTGSAADGSVRASTALTRAERRHTGSDEDDDDGEQGAGGEEDDDDDDDAATAAERKRDRDAIAKRHRPLLPSWSVSPPTPRSSPSVSVCLT
jgi:hypothetical protein